MMDVIFPPGWEQLILQPVPLAGMSVLRWVGLQQPAAVDSPIDLHLDASIEVPVLNMMEGDSLQKRPFRYQHPAGHDPAALHAAHRIADGDRGVSPVPADILSHWHRLVADIYGPKKSDISHVFSLLFVGILPDCAFWLDTMRIARGLFSSV